MSCGLQEVGNQVFFVVVRQKLAPTGQTAAVSKNGRSGNPRFPWSDVYTFMIDIDIDAFNLYIANYIII